MRKILSAFVCILLLSQGCVRGQGAKKIAQNDKIEPAIKTTVTALNKQAYTYMCDNNYDGLSAMFSDSLKMMMQEGFAKQFMPAMQRIMKGHDCRVYDEFYIKDAKPGDSVTLSSGKGDEAYTTKVLAKNTDTYVAMMIAGDKVDEVMLTITWTNIKGKWQIYSITGEDYSLMNKNAVALYYYALSLEKKGYLVDASNVMGLSLHCINPGGHDFSFSKQAEIIKFNDTLNSHVNALYKFPHTMSDIATKPAVVNIHFELDRGEFVPMVVYQSIINVRDSISLGNENKALQQQVNKVFTGMDKVNKRIFYRAYNELPSGNSNPRYFGFTQSL